jgi:hypothetical protein
MYTAAHVTQFPKVNNAICGVAVGRTEPDTPTFPIQRLYQCQGCKYTDDWSLSDCMYKATTIQYRLPHTPHLRLVPE